VKAGQTQTQTQTQIEGLSESIKRAQALSPEAPVLVLSLRLDLPVALAALKAGARGFIHAVMEPAQIARAFSVAFGGEMVAPRKLLEFIVSGGVSAVTNHRPIEHAAFTPRQIEILGLVTEGLNNNEIARHLFLSESTVKQHLRGAYKILGAKNRTEAVRRIRNAG
jgi:DNA-binding NarL/FixJ family response regulator